MQAHRLKRRSIGTAIEKISPGQLSRSTTNNSTPRPLKWLLVRSATLPRQMRTRVIPFSTNRSLTNLTVIISSTTMRKIVKHHRVQERPQRSMTTLCPNFKKERRKSAKRCPTRATSRTIMLWTLPRRIRSDFSTTTVNKTRWPPCASPTTL